MAPWSVHVHLPLPLILSLPSLSDLLTCTTDRRLSVLKVSEPTERTVLSELLSQVTFTVIRLALCS